MRRLPFVQENTRSVSVAALAATAADAADFSVQLATYNYCGAKKGCNPCAAKKGCNPRAAKK